MKLKTLVILKISIKYEHFVSYFSIGVGYLLLQQITPQNGGICCTDAAQMLQFLGYYILLTVLIILVDFISVDSSHDPSRFHKGHIDKVPWSMRHTQRQESHRVYLQQFTDADGSINATSVAVRLTEKAS